VEALSQTQVQPQSPSQGAEELKKAVDAIAELKKAIEEKLKAVDAISEKVSELEKKINLLERKLLIQKVAIKSLRKRLEERWMEDASHQAKATMLKRMMERRRLAREELEEKETPKPEEVFKSEEVKKKLEELRKKIAEKKAKAVATPRPETATSPEPSNAPNNEFQEFIRKILSGKATASDLPAQFRVLPKIEISGGEKK
jgi:chromosome segregation ATPase